MRVLIINDDTDLIHPLRELFAGQGVELDAHHTGSDAAARAIHGHYALVVLEATLQDTSGLEVLSQIRAQSSVPVILLTGHGHDVGHIVGMELGADAHVQTPLDANELLARVRAVMRRRSHGDRGRQIIRVDDVRLDTTNRSVFRAGVPVELTDFEFRILRRLIQSAGEIVSRQTLVEKAFGRQFDPRGRSVDMHVSRLRRKLGRHADGDERIATVWRIGYVYRRVQRTHPAVNPKAGSIGNRCSTT